MTDILRRAANRLRIAPSCENCLTTALLKYIGHDGNHHKFRCEDCGSPVLFDGVVKDFKRDDADVIPIGGARVDGGAHSINPVTDTEFGGDDAA